MNTKNRYERQYLYLKDILGKKETSTLGKDGINIAVTFVALYQDLLALETKEYSKTDFETYTLIIQKAWPESQKWQVNKILATYDSLDVLNNADRIHKINQARMMFWYDNMFTSLYKNQSEENLQLYGSLQVHCHPLPLIPGNLFPKEYLELGPEEETKAL